MTPRLADTPVLETARLTLRAPGPQDWEAFAAFVATDRARYVGGPYTRPLAWRSFCHVTGNWVARGYSLVVFTLKGTDAAIGSTGPWFPEGWPEPELGWALWTPEAEGKGYAAEAAAAARDFAYGALGWDTAVSYINPANTRSIRVAERLGARPDPDATKPEGDDCLVYRHPAPRDLMREALA